MLALAAIALISGQCPAPAAIQQKLSALRGADVSGPRYQVEVGRSGEYVLVTARDAQGRLYVQRELPVGAPCGELEDAAAVVLLTWEAQLAPGDVPVPEVHAAVEPTPVIEPLSLDARVHAGAQLWLSSAAPTWGATGSVELHGRWLGVELAVSGQGRRFVGLGEGVAVWSRFSVSVGPVATLQVIDGLDVWLGAALVGGPFWVSGGGFDTRYSLFDWDFGLSAAAKVLLPGFWKLRPFVGAGGLFWLRRHVVEARTPDAARVVPFLEASPMVGLVFTP